MQPMLEVGSDELLINPNKLRPGCDGGFRHSGELVFERVVVVAKKAFLGFVVIPKVGEEFVPLLEDVVRSESASSLFVGGGE